MSDDLNEKADRKHAIDALCERIMFLINTAEVDKAPLHNGQRLYVGMLIVGDVLSSILCRGCREKTFELMQEVFPDILEEAMERPTLDPPASEHTH